MQKYSEIFYFFIHTSPCAFKYYLHNAFRIVCLYIAHPFLIFCFLWRDYAYFSIMCFFPDYWLHLLSFQDKIRVITNELNVSLISISDTTCILEILFYLRHISDSSSLSPFHWHCFGCAFSLFFFTKIL